jgi:alpha-galactosidase
MIGAGSVVFSKNLTGDILSYAEFKNAHFSYMDIDADRLEVGANLCRKVAKALGADPKIEATQDRRAALDGADFVINMVQIGGFDSTLVDFEIPRKYGLNFTIADTTGPGGLFRALRTYPMLTGLCCDMEELCPRALLLNYSNPMSMNMHTITRTGSVRAVGLCHSVQGTFNQLMGYLKEDPARVAFVCAGINHMAFYLRIEKDGVDQYPRLFAAMNDPAIYASNKVRFELMKRLGYFVTESSEHNAEYSPWFIPHGQESLDRFGVPIDEYLRRCDGIVDEFERMRDYAKNDQPMEVHRSQEYGSTIIHSMSTGRPSVVYGNMPNRGAIANLPDDAIAEAPTLVDRNGCRFTTVGPLPPQLIAYMHPHVSQHELFIRAATEGRRDHVYQAAMFDPLTAATLSLDQIVDMCDELIAAHGGLLPPLDAKKTLVPTGGKAFGAVDAKSLRRSWDETHARRVVDYILNWHVIGPFRDATPQTISLDLTTPVESDFARSVDGSVDLSKTYSNGSGAALAWMKATARRKGNVNFDDTIGRHEFAVAYAYTEIESVHPRDAELRCGSDDGIRIWLNGKLVHDHEVRRGFAPDSDKVLVHLKAGRNCILVKVDNFRSGWGFGVAIPKPNF